MTRYFSVLLLAGVFLSLASAPARAANDTETTASGDLHLPPKIRSALIEEMAALQPAMAQLAEVIPQGDWKRIAETAAAMRDGFILNKALTQDELQTLQNALPEGFLVVDTRFHSYADKLASAARAHDGELVPFYFYKMTETCVACHAAYAGTRFPGYRPPQEPQHHHH
ncbi:MAG: hypothetical protein WCZ87_04050 [Thiohalobacteraceae bacterium]